MRRIVLAIGAIHERREVMKEELRIRMDELDASYLRLKKAVEDVLECLDEIELEAKDGLDEQH
jgi:hypothetical protein